MQDHIRPVPEPASQGQEPPQEERQDARRSATIPRTTRPLPTDRLKFETQVAALKAIAIKSEFGKQSVGANDLSSALSLVPATAGLNNAFFVDSGLATREGRGQYKPTAVANEFARKHSFDEAAAGRILARALVNTWYYRAVTQLLAIRTVTREQAIEALADEAGATKERQTQLGSLLEWLQYAGLIDATGAHVTLADTSTATSLADAQKETAVKEQDEKSKPGAPSPEGTTTRQRRVERPQADTVLSLSFDFALTVDELAALSPDQIKTLFESVGAVMAIKAKMT